MKPNKVRHFTAAMPKLARCPVCRSDRGVRGGVFVQHYHNPQFVRYTQRQAPSPYCLGSGMRAGVTSGSAN